MITEIISNLKQGFENLEKGNVSEAKSAFENVLKKDSKNGQAYAGLLLIEKGLSKLSELETLNKPFDHSENYKKAIAYGGKDLCDALNHCLSVINKRIAKAEKERLEKEEKERLEAEAKAEELRKAHKPKSEWQKNAEKEQEILAYALRTETQKSNERKKRQKIACMILCAVLIFSVSGAFLLTKSDDNEKNDIEDSSELRSDNNTELEKANKLLEDGNYIEAYSLFKILEASDELKAIEENADTYAKALCEKGEYETTIEFLELTDKTDSDILHGAKMVLQGDYKGAIAKGLTKLVLPQGVMKIESEAFFGCSSLEKIVIPEGVTFIGAFAFEGCSSLVEVVLPQTLSAIDENAFYNCKSLKKITIPKNVAVIGRSAFEGCSLEWVSFENAQGWTVDDVEYSPKDEAQTAKELSETLTGTWSKYN